MSQTNIVVLTGSGVSAESGIATFRDLGGLWAGHKLDEVCTLEALERNPDFVCGFYDDRKRSALQALPNAAHLALVDLERYWSDNAIGEFLLVTQNLDDLHERAGSKNLVHMHGDLNSVYCTECGISLSRLGPLEGNRECPDCFREALRPNVVFFGEAPRGLPKIDAALRASNIFVAIGTSGIVYPASGFSQLAASCGAVCVLLNLEEPKSMASFMDFRQGLASLVVPLWVEEAIGLHAGNN